jgi:hypothetical protein
MYMPANDILGSAYQQRSWEEIANSQSSAMLGMISREIWLKSDIYKGCGRKDNATLCIKAAASKWHTQNTVSTKILGGDHQSSQNLLPCRAWEKFSRNPIYTKAVDKRIRNFVHQGCS